jgi:hypothetical protein
MRYNLIIVALMVMVLSALTGCGGAPKAPPTYRPSEKLVTAPVHQAQTDSASAKAYIDAAEALTQQVLDGAKATGDRIAIALLEGVSLNHGKATEKQGAVEAKMSQTLVENGQLKAEAVEAVEAEQAHARAWEDRYTKLDGKWYVRWGRWIEAVVFWLVVGWAAAGLASVFLGFQPLGMLQKLSGFIVHLLPLGNVWVWIEDLIKWVRGAPAQKPEP